MKIELLYFEGCPSQRTLLSRLQVILAAERIDEEIELRQIETLEDAERESFLGSPTLRVNGEDVDPGATGRGDFGMKCRLYRSAEGTSGTPPDDWITDALRRHGSSLNRTGKPSRPDRIAGGE